MLRSVRLIASSAPPLSIRNAPALLRSRYATMLRSVSFSSPGPGRASKSLVRSRTSAHRRSSRASFTATARARRSSVSPAHTSPALSHTQNATRHAQTCGCTKLFSRIGRLPCTAANLETTLRVTTPHQSFGAGDAWPCFHVAPAKGCGPRSASPQMSSHVAPTVSPTADDLGWDSPPLARTVSAVRQAPSPCTSRRTSCRGRRGGSNTGARPVGGRESGAVGRFDRRGHFS